MAAERSTSPHTGDDVPAAVAADTDADQAMQQVAEAIALDDGDAILTLASALERNQPRLADRVLRVASRDMPTHESLWHAYAQLAEQRQDWQSAINRWWLTRKHHPASNRSHLGYAAAALQLGRANEAERAIASAIDALGSDQQLVAMQERIAKSASRGAVAIDNPPSIAPEDREAVRKLLLGFESLGRNCEFGILQRQFGGEPLGLLRFASTNFRSLMVLLRTSFAGIGETPATELTVGEGEYRLHHAPSGWRMHTRIYERSMPDREKVLREQLRHSKFLRSKLTRELRSASKIFVYWKTDIAPAEIDRLYDVLQSYGPNMLLCVRLSDADHPVGTVEWRQPRLMVAFIDRQGQEFGGTGWDISVERWVAFCRIAAGRKQELMAALAA